VDNIPSHFTNAPNGIVGFAVNSSDEGIQKSAFSQMWETGKLLNPVIGFRFDPRKPRITIGALDPVDYAGALNWVPITEASSVNTLDSFVIYGIKGYNGSFIPIGDNLKAIFGSGDALNSIPNLSVLTSNPGYLGPVGPTTPYPRASFGEFSVNCNGSYGPIPPSIGLAVSINGIDYPINLSELLLPQDIGYSKECQVTIGNDTLPGTVWLGQPFLRSVYLAYRFPTNDGCPGFYGFAFASDSNRTESQISQKPSTVPALASKCLSNLVTPTSSPLTAPSPTPRKGRGSGSYGVYRRPGDGQVPLVGAEQLEKLVWGDGVRAN
jgi:hypothetical protein